MLKSAAKTISYGSKLSRRNLVGSFMFMRKIIQHKRQH